MSRSPGRRGLQPIAVSLVIIALGLTWFLARRPGRPLIKLAGVSRSPAQRVGRLPLWEGGGKTGSLGGPVNSDEALVVSDTRGATGMLAQLWRSDGGVSLKAATFDGQMSTLALDDLGMVAWFLRPFSASGGFMSGHDQLLIANVRDGTTPRSAGVPVFNGLRGGTLTRICGGRGRLDAWIERDGGYAPVPLLGGPAEDRLEPQPPFRCAGNARCSSVLLDRLSEPSILEVRCDATIEREPLTSGGGVDLMSAEGTLVGWEGTASGSVFLQVRHQPVERFSVPGQVYAVTFWDAKTLLVHAARPGTGGTTHLFAIRHALGEPSSPEVDLDDFRATVDLTRHADFEVLPEEGNGRPLLARVGDSLVLISGEGDVWAWPLEP